MQGMLPYGCASKRTKRSTIPTSACPYVLNQHPCTTVQHNTDMCAAAHQCTTQHTNIQQRTKTHHTLNSNSRSSSRGDISMRNSSGLLCAMINTRCTCKEHYDQHTKHKSTYSARTAANNIQPRTKTHHMLNSNSRSMRQWRRHQHAVFIQQQAPMCTTINTHRTDNGTPGIRATNPRTTQTCVQCIKQQRTETHHMLDSNSMQQQQWRRHQYAQQQQTSMCA